MGKKFFIIFGILFFAVTAFAGEWSTRYNGHTRKQDWIRGDDPVFSGTLTTGSLLIDGTAPDDLYVNITGDTMTGQLQATTLTDGTLEISGGELTTTGDIYVGSFRSPEDSSAHVRFDESAFANLDMVANGGICLHAGDVGVYSSSFVRFGGVLLSNTDLVFECDGDNNGSNKFSWTDGASVEIMSLSEAGTLTLFEDGGANFASFMVPALAANTVYTLPPDDGDPTEQLQTDGSGVLTWVSAGGAVEGTDVLSTGEEGASKFLREDGDGTCSWQAGGGGETLAETLAIGADANDLDITSMAQLQGVDVNTYIDMDTTDIITTKGNLIPSANGADDLGTDALEYMNAWFDGTVNIDALVADTADINAGTVDAITSLTLANSVDVGDVTITANGITIDGTLTDGTLSITGGVVTGATLAAASNVIEADTVITITGLAPDTATTQVAQGNITSATALPWTGLKPGTDGEIPTFDASGNPAFVAVGTATHVLTSNGVDTAPTFQAASGGGGGLAWEVISGADTATSGEGFLIDSSGGVVTLTLPSTPSEGDTVAVCDYTNSATTNAITVGRNSSNIEGVAADLVIDVDGAGFTLVYSDATRGWVIVTEI